MAYVNLVNFSCANRAAALTQIWTYLANAGWSLTDNQDGSSYRVYSSTGELSDRIAEYVKIDWITAARITVGGYYYWNATTHTGNGAPYDTPYVTTQESVFYLWLYGDSNLFLINTKVSTTYYNMLFGHLPKKMYPTPETYLTADASSGSTVTLTVDNTYGFVPQKHYQVLGASGEGRDSVTISSITDSTHMVITTLPRNYGINSKIGSCTSTFGTTRVTGNPGILVMTSSWDCVGLAAYLTNSNSQITSPLVSTMVTPDNQANAYPVYLWYVYTSFSAAKYAHIGYCDANILRCNASTAVSGDTFTVGEQVWGTSSGSNDGTHLNDTTKTWTTNAWQNKVLVITSGIGIGQTRVIASNTATQITINTAWTTIPDATSIYIVCDEVYRLMGGTNWFSCKEIV